MPFQMTAPVKVGRFLSSAYLFDLYTIFEYSQPPSPGYTTLHEKTVEASGLWSGGYWTWVCLRLWITFPPCQEIMRNPLSTGADRFSCLHASLAPSFLPLVIISSICTLMVNPLRSLWSINNGFLEQRMRWRTLSS